MPLVYYYDLMSPPCRALYIFLKVMHTPFESKEFALRKLEHMTDEYSQINPFKKVPVIDDSGFILTESVAIFMYLCDKYKKYGWYPMELKERARVNEYAHWQNFNLRANSYMLYRTKIITPRITKKPPNERELEECHERWESSIDDLENIWLKRSSYLADDHLTFADLLGICELMLPIAAGYHLNQEKFPRVHDWMQRVKQETQPYFDEAHAASMRMRREILKNQNSKL
ncbi:unnamed protein product [Adineta steineri]|uniref:Uncharacterized protein n=1 Tax=Adineta steineri TaxID=433720 RepID=A0A815C8Y5_9BILA|nr:unnamed protein product [Adineta steineri]CAF1280446.1 unnamed protein product [Adineta steineri]CAF3621868.1 unnamed protein product [Adineta steineri]CAF3876704.1 unnamed protein product [Adineta steineri]